MDLDSIAKVRYAFYRAVGSKADDDALLEQGESADDVAYLYLTRGIRAAQRFLIDAGLAHRWRKRSSAITSWSGADETDGGRYSALPSDFLRLYGQARSTGSRRTGGLVEADGEAWGYEGSADEDHLRGDLYYLKNDQVWIAHSAAPPSTVYLQYHYRHPALDADTASFDMPVDAMPLAVAYAANAAKEESWLPGGPEMEGKIERALLAAQAEGRSIARQDRGARRFEPPRLYGTRW